MQDLVHAQQKIDASQAALPEQGQEVGHSQLATESGQLVAENQESNSDERSIHNAQSIQDASKATVNQDQVDSLQVPTGSPDQTQLKAIDGNTEQQPGHEGQSGQLPASRGSLRQQDVQQNPPQSQQGVDPSTQEEIKAAADQVADQRNIPSRQSKQSQSQNFGAGLSSNRFQSNQQIHQQEPVQPPKERNFDQVESVIVKKNQSGQIIKKVVQVIKITRSSKRKPFIGGFQHTSTEIIYHNAFSQTDQNRTEHKLMFTREVQTYDYSSRSSKVPREFGTQMQKDGLYVDQRNDKIMYPRFYFDSQMWLQRRIEAALYIQRLTRGMFARRETNQLKQQKFAKQLHKFNKDEDVRKKEEVKHKKQIQRRRNPRTKEDFQILYEELENWRMAEIQKINDSKSLTVEQRRRALKETLDKQTDLLQTIDRLKIIAAKDNKEHKIQKFLKSMSDPKKWLRPTDGRVTEVHTPFTVRAKELMDLYKGLRMKGVSTDERLDILLATKWTVKEWDCNLTREIVDLIDREGTILDRGRPQNSLQGLRQRLANLFLQFIQYPLFNPEAARFQKIPYEIAQVGEELK